MFPICSLVIHLHIGISTIAKAIERYLHLSTATHKFVVIYLILKPLYCMGVVI